MGIIVLAGGYGRNFQKKDGWVDKLEIEIKGLPLLVRTVKNLKNVDEDIVVTTKPNRFSKYSKMLDGLAEVIIDDPPIPEPCILAGVNAGRKKLKNKYITLVGGDMPFVKPEVLDLLLGRVKEGIVPLWPNGVIEPLLSVYKRDRLAFIEEIIEKKGLIRATDIIRGFSEVEFIPVNDIAEVDPNLSSLISIDRPESLDLKYLKVDGTAKSLTLKGHSSLFLKAIGLCFSGKYREAVELFRVEAELYGSVGLELLKKHAMRDAEFCEKNVKGVGERP